jgi:uncharacterized membrane protein
MVMRGLIIRSPRIEKIIEGEKTWEIRGSNTKTRGTIALIRSGSGLVVGTCKLVDVVGPLSPSGFKRNAARHCVKVRAPGNHLPYKKTYAWVLSDATPLKKPRPYQHPQGAAIWVNLPPGVSRRVFASISRAAVKKGCRALSGWSNRKISEGYVILSEAVTSSKAISRSTGETILRYVSSAQESAARSSRKITDSVAISLNAILASDFSRSMEAWLGGVFNEGMPSVYDKAMDTVYNATHAGGGHLHRLFDGSHSLLGMWDKIGDAKPDDTLLQEMIGYTTALGKDLSSSVGVPLFDLSKSSYDRAANALNQTFHVPMSWFSDILHVNATELIGTSIGTIAVALHWNDKQVEEFSRLAGSLGISAIAAANPTLAVVTLATLAKSYVDARQEAAFGTFVKGLAQGGVGTAAFLATAAAIGGPAWIGLIAGTCMATVVHKSMGTLQLIEISAFVERSMKRELPELGH